MGSIEKIHEMLVSKECSCTELTKSYLDEIEKADGELNAYVNVTGEEALKTAEAVDRKIASGEEIGMLEGVPMTLKDNISTKGIETTCCSKILTGYKPIYNATVWETLAGENAVMLGKTNMDEFAMGSSCETSYFGGAMNPFDSNYVSGGSSGGAVAKNVVKDTSKNLSGAFKNLYEKSGFKGFVENVQKGINKVDWSAIGKNCKTVFDNAVPIVQKAFGTMQKVGSAKLGAIGSAFGAVATIGGKSFQTILGGVAKWISKDREKIIGFIDTIGNNLTNGYNNLSTFFDNFGTLAGNAIDNVRPQMEESISNLFSDLTTFAGSVGEVVSGAFSTATESLVEWTENDGATITEFLENLQLQFADVFNFIGQIFGDIGTIISNWWNGNGQQIFQNICNMFTNIGTTLMNVYNQWIKPAWDFIVAIVKSAWENWLKPVFEGAINFFGKVADCVSTVWNNFLSPFVNWLVSFWGPIFQNVFNAVKRVFDNVFTFIGGLITSIQKTFGGLIDFITGVFSGDWKKAWQGIYDFFKGIWDGICAVFKFIINAIIDGINALWTGIYNFVSGVVNSIGGIAGIIGAAFGQDWSFSMPENPPLIPRFEEPTESPARKFAKGGIVKAPTLAVVGDNAGANSGNPEVISPLNKLQGMLDNSGGQDTVILTQILDLLKRIYEMFIIFRNNGGNTYSFTAELEGSTLFEEMIRQDELYRRRHNGKSAFA